MEYSGTNMYDALSSIKWGSRHVSVFVWENLWGLSRDNHDDDRPA